MIFDWETSCATVIELNKEIQDNRRNIDKFNKKNKKIKYCYSCKEKFQKKYFENGTNICKNCFTNGIKYF
ncbi:hypothetical protein MKD35_293 [Aureococcus anophagefferens virus]|nr:hypothetical protein MKD35_293 [Aureococcus anophagefferens virus]